VQEPHQSLLTVILITAVSARGYQTDGARFQKLLSQHLVTGTGDCVCLEENLDISYLQEIVAEYLTRLTLHRDVSMTVLFQHPSVIKDLVFLLVVPSHEFSSF